MEVFLRIKDISSPNIKNYLTIPLKEENKSFATTVTTAKDHSLLQARKLVTERKELQRSATGMKLNILYILPLKTYIKIIIGAF